MKVIRFHLEGFLNSFRVPFFRTYHKTFLAPPKTTIIGMLCNISLKSQKEFFDILEKDKIELSVIIEEIQGRSKDLWSYKTLDKKNRGKSVIRRDKLFRSSYVIYLTIKDKKLYQEVFKSLKEPKSIPSLGLDDELVVIKSVKEIELKEDHTNRVDSVFLDKGIQYKAYIKDIGKIIELPTSNMIPVKFKISNKKNKLYRSAKDEFLQVEFLNCEIEFQEPIKILSDQEFNYRLVFF
jgi:CRISPR-associated protein Cas5t